MDRLFAGIDPGELKGGIGIIDYEGKFILAERWNRKDPRATYNILYKYKDMIEVIYIEDVNLPQTGNVANQFSGSSNLMVNFGIWQGMCLALDIKPVLVHPNTWQAAFNLHHWQAAQKKNSAAPGPLDRARQLWPVAPLQFKMDDGKAVGLLLADFARRDHLQGIDRRIIRAQAQEKAKVKKKAKKAAAKKNREIGPTSDIGFL